MLLCYWCFRILDWVIVVPFRIIFLVAYMRIAYTIKICTKAFLIIVAVVIGRNISLVIGGYIHRKVNKSPIIRFRGFFLVIDLHQKYWCFVEESDIFAALFLLLRNSHIYSGVYA